MINLIRNPDVYHGENKKSNFFEGWYFKLVHPLTGCTYCFIPGIFISSEKEYSHSFIQILKGNENKFKYIKFKEDEFKASSSKFDLRVGENFFAINQIDLNIKEQHEMISGTLYFDNIIKWPDSMINPGSMGFYNYLNFMQCYSQVCAIDGFIRGKLFINGETVDFTGGKLYIEKNWGKSFLYSYIWIQGNSFMRKEGAATCSIGQVPLPFPFKSFTGFLIGIYIGGRFYKFTSINKSSLSVKCEDEKIFLKAYNKSYFLKVQGFYKKQTFMNLYAPSKGNMIPIANETLHGNLNVTLYDNIKGCTIFNDECSSAGIELSENYINLCSK